MTIDQAIDYAVQREEPVAERSDGEFKGAMR